MDDVDFWEGIARDLSGAGRLRLLLQPFMAILLGVRFGLSDVRKGASPFVRRLLESKHERWRLLGRSIRHIWMPLSFALLVDGVLQYVTLGRIRLLPALVVGFLLVWSPFTIARGVTNRILRRSHAAAGGGTTRAPSGSGT